MARGVPCGKEEVGFYRSGAKLKFLISYDLFTLGRRGKKIQPRRVFKKQVFLIRLSSNRLIVPISLRLVFPPLPVATPMVRVRGLDSS